MKRLLILFPILLVITGCSIVSPLSLKSEGEKPRTSNLSQIKPSISYDEVVALIGEPNVHRGVKIMENGSSLKVVEYNIRDYDRTWKQDLKFNALFNIITSVTSGVVQSNGDLGAFTLFGMTTLLDGSRIFFPSRWDKPKEYWFVFEDNNLICYGFPGDWETYTPERIRIEWKEIE